MRRLAIINQKGGVGKTTTAVNLGHALALRGNRVMLVDLDPQSHLATCLGLFRAPKEGADSVILEGASLSECAIATRELMTVVPAGQRLQEVESLIGGIERAKRLFDSIQKAPPAVDYMLFDCPPSAGLLVVNAVLASHDAVIPVAGDYLSLTGLAQLMKTIKKLDVLRSQPLAKWVFLSRYIARRRLSREVLDKLRLHFAQSLLQASVSESAVLAECAAVGRTIFEYRAKSKSAEEFRLLAESFVQGKVLDNES